MEEKGLSLSRAHKVVYDEIDTLLDKNFITETLKVTNQLNNISKARNIPIQSTMVTATISKTLETTIRDNFGDVLTLIAPSLHKTPSRCHQEFLVFNQSTTKLDLTRGILKRGISQTNRVLIFCNTVKSVNELYNSLLEKKYPCFKLSSDMQFEDMQQHYKNFTFEDDEFKIMIATDIASRGIDITNVGIVILYDFPTTIIDYVHRVGRTARFGERGRAFSIISKKDLPLAERIQEKVKRGLALTD